MYRWIAQSLQLSDGTKVKFTGDPKSIWLYALVAGLLPTVDMRLTPLINQIGNEPVFWAYVLGFLTAEAAVYLKIWRWGVAGMSLSSGAVLHFDGGAIACFGWVCIGNLLFPLLVRTRGLILLVVPLVFLWQARWGIGHVHSERRRLRFVASLAQMWWRTLAAMVFSIPLITIPMVWIWTAKWAVGNVQIEPERGSASPPTLTTS